MYSTVNYSIIQQYWTVSVNSLTDCERFFTANARNPAYDSQPIQVLVDNQKEHEKSKLYQYTSKVPKQACP